MVKKTEWCPQHGYPLPCDKCGLQTQDERILITLATMGCKQVNPDNPSRVAVSITSMYDLLKASEKFLHDFDELMIGAGKAKKEGVLHPTDLVHKVEKLIGELHMWTTMARSKIGAVFGLMLISAMMAHFINWQ